MSAVATRGGLDPEVRELLLGIWKTFPDVAQRMKRRARHVGSVRFATCDMMEEFSQVTSDAIRRRDEDMARAHLKYVSRVFANGGAKVREYVDVYYVEVLMYGLDDTSKKWGWKLVPPELQQLYVKFWGKGP